MRYSPSDNYLSLHYGVPPKVAQAGDLRADHRASSLIADDAKLKRRVVLRLANEGDFKPEEVYRFQTESEILSQINCSSFLQPIDWGVAQEIVFSVREERSSATLQTILESQRDASRPGLPLAQAFSIVCGVLDALKHVHQSGCVYRNICSSKILVAGDRALLTCPDPFDYQESSLSGRVDYVELARYASPERSGSIEHDIGPAADLYSVGVLLFTLLAGRHPFQGETVGTILFQHTAIDPELGLLGSDVPAIATEIVARLLRKEPRDRYQSAEAAYADVKRVADAIKTQKPLDGFVIGRQDTRSSIIEPAFVGRQAELQEIQDRLKTAAEGASQRLGILCPSGIGKSRIVLESIRQATRKGFIVFRSVASNQASQIPTAPLRAIVEQLASQVRLCEQLRTRLTNDLAEVQDEISILFPELAEALGWPTASVFNGEGLDKSRLEAAFCQVFASLGDRQKPAFIWIDDCQWLDAQSLGILEKLTSYSLQNSLFIFSMRPDEGVADSFCDRVGTELNIHLQALRDDEVQAMIESMAGRLPQEVVDTVIKLAAGSPFMASAILRGMTESGALQSAASGWQVDREKLQKIQASSNAAEALLHRLENVPEAVLRQLSVAAIIGKEFDEKTVVELSPIPLKESKACFDWSRQQRLIWSMPNGNFTFIHDKIRETLIDRLSPAERKRIHLLYAEHLQRLDSDYAFELAYHYHSAGSFHAALPYALKAAETARRLHSLDRAEELLWIALHGVELADQTTRHRVQAGLADVLMLAGKYDEAERWFEASLQTAESQLDLARIGVKRGELAFKRGDKENAVKIIAEALRELNDYVPQSRIALWIQLLREIITQILHCVFPRIFLGTRGDSPSEADRLSWRLHSRIAHGYWYTKDKFHVLWAHLREMNLAERYGPTLELGQAYSEHAPAMSLIPWHRRGIQYVQRSLAIRKKLNDIWGQGQSRNFYSILLYSSSQFESCIQQASHAESILLRTGDFWEVNIARYQLAASMYRMGDLKGALEVSRRTYDSALAIGDFQSTGNIIDVWVRAALCELPEDLLAAEKMRTLRDRQGECQVLLAEGIHLFGKKQYREAAGNFSKAIEIAEKAGVVNTFITPNYPWLVTALRTEMRVNPPRTRRAQRQGMKRLYRAARRAVRVGRFFKNDLPHALRELSAVHGLRGNGGRARRAILESIQVASGQKAEYELALSQKAYGLMGRELGWPEADQIGKRGESRIQEIRQPIRQSRSQESMSLFDRFDTLLEAGRQIISAHSAEDIFEKTRDAAKRLLRGQRTLVIEARDTDGGAIWRSLDSNAGFDSTLVAQAAGNKHTVVAEEELIQQNGLPIRHRGAFLCCPITVHEKVVACLYVANEFLVGLFGKNELRIADYLASAAGGALEKADGFRQLERLNISLEQKVQERTAAVEARSRDLEITAQELIATQSKLEQARDEAETANEAKSEFLARMSHEIRTPISAILGFTELMLRGVIRDPEESIRRLETIQANGNHLLQLVNDLLDLSKIEADKMEVESIDCIPVQVMIDVVTSLKVRADQKSIGLKTHVAGKIPRVIKSDPMRLRQILTNLIGNAIKFTAEGQVDVTVRLAPSRQNSAAAAPPRSGGQLEFEVSDSGIGMSPEQMDRIFDPFSQADSTVTRHFGGTGLGLSISKQLAQALGGGISVSSEPGVGSTFTVNVDVGMPESELELLDSLGANGFLTQESKKQNFRANLAGRRILVVDDVQTNRDLLSLVLEDAGADVLLAVNGQEAMNSAFGIAEIDLVLMDMQMPVLDGYSATRMLRENGFLQPIIALTAHAMNGDETKCLDAGCSDYLTKPIDINCLMTKVGSILGVELLEVEQFSPRSQTHSTADSTMPLDPQIIANGGPRWNSSAQDEWPGDEPFRSLALSFVEKLEQDRRAMFAAAEEGNLDDLARFAHWIKGTGGSVGLSRISEMAKQLEASLRARQIESARVTLQEIWDNVDHLRAKETC